MRSEVRLAPIGRAIALLVAVLILPRPGAASSYPPDLRVADDEGGSIIASCSSANGAAGHWVDIPAGVAQQDAYIFRPVGKNDMPGDGIFVTCESDDGSPGVVKTGTSPLPTQFIVHRGDRVVAGDFLILEVSANRGDTLHARMFVVKTYEGKSVVTVGDAMVVIDAIAQTALVFRPPLESTVLTRHRGFGVSSPTPASGAPPACTVLYYDAQMVSSAVSVKVDCDQLGTVVGWPDVIRGQIPAAYLP